jgi:proteasome accessory factor C
VQPHELFSHRGQWYLQGHCLTRQDVRLFRLDRIRTLELTDTRFTPPSDARSQAMVPNAGEDVVVRFAASVAPYVAERFGHEVRWLDQGVLEVRVRGDSEHWLTQWVLSFGGDAWVQAPESARKAVLKAADAIKAP